MEGDHTAERGGLDEAFEEELQSVCRTVVGDELRSITYFTKEEVEQAYLRTDLDQTADLVGFAEFERMGFHAHTAYQDTQLGRYRATIRMFENGYLVRVLGEYVGVWVTTDNLSMERFEELSTALKAVIEGHETEARP